MRASAVLRNHAADLLGIAVTCSVASSAGLASAAIPANERAALIAVYESTNGSSWTDRTHWRNAADTDFAPSGTECTWYGVTCSPAGHVTALTLDGNHLDGTIPSEIGDLAALTTLLLRRNALSGSIPAEVWSLTRLVTLALGGNSLTGSLPAAIGNLTAVEGLDLSANYLTGTIPPEIGNLTRVAYLTLAGNRLSGSIPAEIGNLTGLSVLHLFSNRLTGSIPFQIGNLTLLEELELSTNQLTGPIPPEIGNLRYLSTLLLYTNQLTGSIPPEIGNLRMLSNLYLQGNQLSGPIPPEIGNLTALRFLALAGNGLTGSIPPEIGNLRNLSALYLEYNQLTGPLPPDIGKLTALTVLSVPGSTPGNALTGSIPPEIGNLRNLTALYLASNQLTGSIPRQIGNLTALTFFALSSNRLSGPIPAEIGNLTNLVGFALHDNSLDGPVPPEIGNLSSLQAMDISRNRLQGPLPSTLTNLTGLRNGGADVSYNALYTSDASLRAFLDLKQRGGDWEGTQTVAPAGLAAGTATVDSVPLSWSSILYTGDSGGYRIWYGTMPGGPYDLAATTAGKSVTASPVSGLSPGTTYYFALDTVTEPHPQNPNTVVSDLSAEVSATTAAGGAGWNGLTVVREGPGVVSSSPAGITCGGSCAATFAPGTAVTLTATPDSGSTFLGWGDACAGTARTCDVTMDAAHTVTATFSPSAVSLYTVRPCRAYDSRDLGDRTPLAAGTDTAVLIGGYCGIPAGAKAVSLNVAVVSPSAAGHLRLYASGTPRPTSSSINYGEGQTRANNAVVPLGPDGAVAVYVNQPRGTAHVVLDVSGYFQ
jgi:Leucine-rich repeat (LRR) protein